MTQNREHLKKLHDLAPMNARRLNEQVYTDILIKGESFTKENADDFKEGVELLGKLVMIHHEYRKKQPFGDMFSEYLQEYGRLNFRAGQFFTPYNVAEMMGVMLLTLEEMKGEPLRILDPASGTGRFMLKTAAHYAKEVEMYNFLFTNIDIDKRMFTFCVMNAILYGIPAIHIHGDTLRNKFWDCFATIPITPGICQWKRIDAKLMEKRFAEILEASIPKRGLEIFMDERVKTRAREKRYSTIVKPTQRSLFEK